MSASRSHRSLLLVALATAALVCAAALLAAGPAFAAKSQTSNFDGGRWALDNPERATEEIANLGADYLRIVMVWQNVAPGGLERRRPDFDATDPGAYGGEWGHYQALVAQARAHGLRVILTPSGPAPRWATSNGDGKTNVDATEFGRFVTAVGREFGDDVTYWSFFNEPNQNAFLAPQFRRGRPYSPVLYRRIFLAGQRGLRSAGVRRPKILLGETAPRGGAAVSPLRFLRELLCLDNRYRRKRGKGCVRLNVAGYAHHPYSGRLGPYDRPSNPDDVTIRVLSRLTRALDRAARARRLPRRLGVFITEYGIQTYPDRFLGVPLGRQPEYLGISERMAYRNRRVKTYSQFLMRDDAPRKGGARRRYSGFETGLRTSSGREKPGYDGWRLPLVAEHRGRRGVTIWGLVRPADGRTRVTVEYRDGRRTKWKRLRRVRTDRRGYYSMPTTRRRGRTYRAVWEGPDERTFTGPAIGAFPRP